jgi:hypothetical protein
MFRVAHGVLMRNTSNILNISLSEIYFVDLIIKSYDYLQVLLIA